MKISLLIYKTVILHYEIQKKLEITLRFKYRGEPQQWVCT